MVTILKTVKHIELHMQQFYFTASIFVCFFPDEVPHLKEFKVYCRSYLQNPNPEKRPNLSEVLKDNFFNHEFITIYKFLNFLPLKSEEERNEFFSNILSHLKCYDEETVAKQLGGLLLSRLTLLDQTARKDVLPFILKPKNGRYIENIIFSIIIIIVIKYCYINVLYSYR